MHVSYLRVLIECLLLLSLYGLRFVSADDNDMANSITDVFMRHLSQEWENSCLGNKQT